MEQQPKLGELITHEQKRDAIHFAVAPVTLHKGNKKGSPRIGPGVPLRFAVEGNTELVEQCEWKEAVGIADPFLKVTIDVGQSFWMMLMPNTITSLRHEWSHPAFDGEQRAVSEWWLRDFATKYDVDYNYMMDCLKESDTVPMGDNQIDIDSPDWEKLCKHVAIVTGREDARPYFSCAC